MDKVNRFTDFDRKLTDFSTLTVTKVLSLFAMDALPALFHEVQS